LASEVHQHQIETLKAAKVKADAPTWLAHWWQQQLLFVELFHRQRICKE
jgi:hypothetical protein